MKIALLLLLCSCLPATHNAGVRRMAEAKLEFCRGPKKGVFSPPHCYNEVRDYCRSQGLEKTCGEGYQP